MADGLEGIAGDVLIGQVRALLLNRSPDLLDEAASPTEHALYVESVRGIATEVTALVGASVSGGKRDTAVWAVTLGAAYLIEAALFPEQQLGEFARAEILRRRYEAVLAMLQGQSDTTGVVPPPAPLGTFPPALPYPDPATVWHGWRR